jgi:hypothetical protein
MGAALPPPEALVVSRSHPDLVAKTQLELEERWM